MLFIIQNPVIVNRNADFFTKRIDSIRFVIRIYSNRESECSTQNMHVCRKADTF